MAASHKGTNDFVNRFGNVIGGRVVDESPANHPPVRNFGQPAQRPQPSTLYEMQQSNMQPTYSEPHRLVQSPSEPPPLAPVGMPQYQQTLRVQAAPSPDPEQQQMDMSEPSIHTKDYSPPFPLPPHSNTSQLSPRTVASSPIFPLPPHGIMEPHSLLGKDAPTPELPAVELNGMSQRSLRSLSSRGLPNAQHPERMELQPSTRAVPLANPAMPSTTPIFRPFEPDMLQRAQDVSDEQRRMIQAQHELLQARLHYPQPQMQQYGQMGLTGPGYYPPEFTEAGQVMMGTGHRERQMMQTAATMQGGDVQHHPMAAYVPPEAYLRYMAEQQAQFAEWARAAQQGQTAPQVTASNTPPLGSGYRATYPMPYGHPVMYGYGAMPHHVYEQHPSEQQAQPGWSAEGMMRSQTNDLRKQQHQQPSQMYAGSVPSRLQLPSNGAAQPSFGGCPTTTHQLQHQTFEGHRHSHPGALLSYGPLPGPVDVRMSPPTSSTRPLSPTTSVRGDGFMAPKTQRQDSVAPSLIGSDTVTQHSAMMDQALATVPAVQPLVPTLSMHQFIQAFSNHYRNCPPALATFESLCVNFNNGKIDPTQFYAGVYRIMYRTKSMDLLEGFQEFVPGQWKGRDMTWFHRAIEKEIDDKFGSQRTMGGVPSKRYLGEEAESGRTRKAAKKAVANVKDQLRKVRGQLPEPLKAAKSLPVKLPEPRKSWIVKLPVRFDETARKLVSNKQAPVPDKPRVEEAASLPACEVEAKSTPSRKKKVPINGFRADGQGETPPSKTCATPTRATDAGNTDEQIPRSSPLSSPDTPSATTASSPLDQSAPAKRTTTGQDTEAFSRPVTKFRHGTLSATQVPHVGPIYPTRRAVLARSDKPYLHKLCYMAFSHPQDVKHHATGSASKPVSCPIIKSRNEHSRSSVGRDGEWNAHESCSVSYPDINYTRVKEGFVILDQASLDKLQKALDAGREAKRLREGARETGVKDQPKKENDGAGEDVDEDGNSEEVIGDSTMTDTAASTTTAAEKQDDVVTHEVSAKASVEMTGETKTGQAETVKAADIEAIVNAHMASLLAGGSAQPNATTRKKASQPKRQVVTAGADDFARVQIAKDNQPFSSGREEDIMTETSPYFQRNVKLFDLQPKNTTAKATANIEAAQKYPSDDELELSDAPGTPSRLRAPMLDIPKKASHPKRKVVTAGSDEFADDAAPARAAALGSRAKK